MNGLSTFSLEREMRRRIFFLAVLVGGMLLAPQVAGGTKLLVRVYTTDLTKAPPLFKGLDIAGFKRGEWFDLVTTDEGLLKLKSLGWKVQVRIPDIERYERQVKGEYHTYQQVVDSLRALAIDHPEIVSLDTLGWTYEGREILALKISDNVGAEEGEAELLFMGLHHAREWPALEIPLFFADTLVRGYGSDPHITEVVNQREIWIIPCVNPDGYHYCHDLGHDWRKNRRYFPEFNTYGVDLNRNYDGSCNGDRRGEWGCIPGWATTHWPSYSLYDGPSPFSEEETQAVRDLVAVHNFVFTVSYHTYSECVMWPWGYHIGVQVPDNELISGIGQEMAARITRQGGSGTYDAFQSAGPGMYPTTGDTDDWVYGFMLFVAGGNSLPYTVEACSDFHPSESVLNQVERENLNGALYLCDVADSVAGLLTPRVMPPVVATPDSISAGSYTIRWAPQNPAAQPDRYELDELSGLYLPTDEGEGWTNSLWEMGGFSVNTSRYHSSTHSYYSTTQSGNDVTTMTTKYPLPVSSGDSLSFWCWYDIEEGWDYAYVEVSPQGRQWYILDQFTGEQKSWMRKSYSLEGFAGGSIFLQFRYITDDATQNEGFYVDDIHPVPYFSKIDTLSAALTDTFYQVEGRPDATYYYRVRGHNQAHSWGDFSQLKPVTIGVGVTEGGSSLDLPTKFGLFQNYPNPFNSTTVIRYSLPGDRSSPTNLKGLAEGGSRARATSTIHVRLEVYNILGQRVATLVDEKQTPGYKMVTWDAAGMASGIYFSRLKAGGFTSVRKMILLK